MPRVPGRIRWEKDCTALQYITRPARLLSCIRGWTISNEINFELIRFALASALLKFDHTSRRLNLLFLSTSLALFYAILMVAPDITRPYLVL